MSPLLLILILLLLFGVGGAPYWGWHNYGWYPAGGIGLVLLIILIVLLVRGRL